MNQQRRRLYSIKEAAEQCSIGRSKVYELIGAGEIAVVKIGRRSLIPADSLEAYVERLMAAVS